jgi:hypothetical protein
VIRKGKVAAAFVAKLMLSFVPGDACATISVFGSEAVPPGTGVVTEIASDPAVAMSEAGIDAKSCVALTNVVNRELPFTFTTALGANPPPFTVKVNAGPPVATTEGEMEVSSMPVPVRFALSCVAEAEVVTLMVAISLPAGSDGVNVRLVSHAVSGFSMNGTVVGQAAFPSPLATKGTR